MMSAVKTEQERRCSLDQNYTTNFDSLSDVIASNNTKNYTYSLQSQGISAKSNSGDYTLKILSYEDGSYCCTGAGCKKLNKNYPDCAGLSFPEASCAGVEGEVTPPGTEPEETPECTDGAVQGSQSCNGCGTQTTQKCVGGKWVASLGSCSKTVEDCSPRCPAKPDDVVKNCECGTVTASHKCDASTNYQWVQEEFPACPSKPTDITETCSDGKTVRTKTYSCVNNVWTAGEWDKECPTMECTPGETQTGSACGNCGKQTRTCGTDGQWGDWSCTGQGVCVPGTTSQEGCAFTGQSKTCNSSCQWNTCQCPAGSQPWTFHSDGRKSCENVCYCSDFPASFEPNCPQSQCERIGCYGPNPPTGLCDGGVVMAYQP